MTGLLMNTFAIISIRLRGKLTVPPKIIHDEDSNNPRNARYNKALATLKALPVFLAVYSICLTYLVIASQSEGTYHRK